MLPSPLNFSQQLSVNCIYIKATNMADYQMLESSICNLKQSAQVLHLLVRGNIGVAIIKTLLNQLVG